MITTLLLSACAAAESTPGRPLLGTPADREALARDLIAKTMARTAWSPFTAGQPEPTFAAAAGALVPEFRAADTDHALLLALIKLSNLRHDRHLSVEPVEGGLQPPAIDGEAPIQFRTDYGTPSQYSIFVADFERALAAASPAPAVGDVLVAVNGVLVRDYAQRLEPFIRYSTPDKLWWEIALALSRKTWRVAPDLYASGNQVRYALRRADGATYELSLDYRQPGTIEWAGHAAKRYDGFTRILETPSFDAYVHAARRVVLLDWRRFESSGPADIDRLMALADEQALLDHAVFFDGTSSGGGSRGAYVLARLTPRPFKTTFGNLRLSDVTDAFISSVAAAGREPRLVRWLETDVRAALARGDAYSPSVPFKLAEPDAAADGTMPPAPRHFRGGLAAAFTPSGGSHLDQFAAMIVDNDLGYTVGMPAGGYSNTWEWTETLRLPDGRPLASFMWNIGHTLRPNGEILEGKAARPADPLPLTRDNFPRYHQLLIERALAYFARRTS